MDRGGARHYGTTNGVSEINWAKVPPDKTSGWEEKTGSSQWSDPYRGIEEKLACSSVPTAKRPRRALLSLEVKILPNVAPCSYLLAGNAGRAPDCVMPQRAEHWCFTLVLSLAGKMRRSKVFLEESTARAVVPICLR